MSDEELAKRLAEIDASIQAWHAKAVENQAQGHSAANAFCSGMVSGMGVAKAIFTNNEKDESE